jgi:hypothetical protein
VALCSAPDDPSAEYHLHPVFGKLHITSRSSSPRLRRHRRDLADACRRGPSVLRKAVADDRREHCRVAVLGVTSRVHQRHVAATCPPLQIRDLIRVPA